VKKGETESQLSDRSLVGRREEKKGGSGVLLICKREIRDVTAWFRREEKKKEADLKRGPGPDLPEQERKKGKRKKGGAMSSVPD